MLDKQMAARIRATVPEEVRMLPGWLIWREEYAGSKPLKVPYYATDGVKRNGKQNAPEELPKLVTFEEAVTAAQKLVKAGREFHGFGFAPRPDFDVTILDFDNKQRIAGLAQLHDSFAGLAPGAYRETSPSGLGSHLAMRGNGLPDAKYHDIGVEVFTAKGYVTVTGDAPPGGQLVDMPDELREALRRAAAVEALVPQWQEPKRHALALALSGAMLSAGHTVESVARFIHMVATAAGDEELVDRVRTARSTDEARRAGEPCTGLPTLAELAGEQCVRKLKPLLGLADPLHGIRVGGKDSFTTFAEDAGELVTQCLADVQMMPVTWLWHLRIPRGKLTIIAGRAGVSKSTLMCEIAATVSRGGDWPIDRVRCAGGEVLIINVEDDAADTIKPRLQAAGADMARVHFVPGVRLEGGKTRLATFNDVDRVDKLLAANPGRFALLTWDPVGAFMAGKDSHRDSEVRSLLAPLAEVAARHCIAMVLVAHFNKGVSNDALARIVGSVGFGGAVRCAYILARDTANDKQLLWLPAKTNNAPAGMAGLAYHLENVNLGPGIDVPRIVWDGIDMRSADEALAPPLADREAPERESAEAWLRERLADGPVAVRKLREEAGLAIEASWATVERAARRLGVVGQGEKKVRTWELPAKQQNSKPSPSSGADE